MSARSRRVDASVVAMALAVVAMVSWPTASAARCSRAIAAAWALLSEPGTAP